jgi:hypothetical protein
MLFELNEIYSMFVPILFQKKTTQTKLKFEHNKQTIKKPLKRKIKEK